MGDPEKLTLILEENPIFQFPVPLLVPVPCVYPIGRDPRLVRTRASYARASVQSCTWKLISLRPIPSRFVRNVNVLRTFCVHTLCVRYTLLEFEGTNMSVVSHRLRVFVLLLSSISIKV